MSASAITTPCSVCNAPTGTRFHELYDDRYGYPGLFGLQECKSCGHLHISANFSPEELENLYTGYYPRSDFSMDTFRPEEERRGFFSWLNGDGGSAFRWVPHNVRILDIGCGVGQTLAYHKRRGCDAVGIEADANVQPIAKRFGLDIRQGIFDGTQYEPESFDYITLDQVAEHVVDPHALMQGVARVLKPKGKVIITTPNPYSLGARTFGRRWLNWHVPYHQQFFTRKSLGLVAQNAGFSVLRGETVTPSLWQYYQWRHAEQFPGRGEKSSFWSSTGASRAPSAASGLIERARRWGLHRWITRFLDAIGLGDNYIFILRKS